MLREAGLDGGHQVLEGLVPTDEPRSVEVVAYRPTARLFTKVDPERLQHCGDVVRVAQSLLGPLRQEPQDQGLERGGQSLGQVARRHRRVANVPMERGLPRVRRERYLPRHTLVEDAANGVEVGVRVHQLPQDLFGGHVGGSPGAQTAGLQALPTAGPEVGRQAEVE